MFNKDNFEKLGSEIYLYRNFIDKDYCDEILKEVDQVKVWEEFAIYGRHMSGCSIKSLEPVREKIRSLVDENYFLGNSTGSQMMPKGSWCPPHSDNYQFLDVIKAQSEYVDGEPFDLKENSQYGTVFYFNKFEGGNLSYPTQGVSYHPEPGDLVIHSSFEIAQHEISEVISDTRYSYANHIYELIKVPEGYFGGV